jgi:hypothetical protein
MKLILAALAFVGAAQPGSPPAPRAPALPPPPPFYGNDDAWLCLPGRPEDPCGAPLPTTALHANGYGSVGRSEVAANPPVDCFYVYPTVSADRETNSDLDVGEGEEIAAVRSQFARFASVCRTFAPIYRSVTIAGLVEAFSGANPTGGFATSYADVLAAWRQFLASRNQGRPFVLIGHSQGSIHLQKLIQEEIEGKPIAANMVSAIILGWNVEVPQGAVVGGTFKSTPLCTRPGQTGCVITYVSFRHETPPPLAAAIFGRAPRAGMTVGCTNPATLGAGPAPLDSYWLTSSPIARNIRWSSTGAPPTTFVRTEGLVTGECVNDGQAGYLAIRVQAVPSDERTDEIPGDVVLMGRPAPSWGLHPADIPLALGDLIRQVEAQAAAFIARSGERG